MIEDLPAYVSITFILTTFLTVGFLLYAVKRTVFETVPAKILIFLLAFWIIFTAMLALNGFYVDHEARPPRLLAFGVAPALLVIVAYFLFFRKNFIEKLPLKTLTLLSVIRFAVEIVLMWLLHAGLIPGAMTFEGRNFDILSGLTAPLVYFLAFRGASVNRPLLIVWNLAALCLLINVVATAILAFPSVRPQLPIELQNRAVAYFPFIWLPAVVVPIVFFTHLASLWKLFKNNDA
ncbi:MAG TPA: hypothetical protein VIL74_14340 [Pyrinomonadaceae bacterium]|jgi:hypothetical protein